MEVTVDKLESMFQKADADLDYLSRKLDVEFNKEAGTDGSDVSKNPGKVLEKLAEVKKEYAEVVKEAQDIQDAQKEAMNFFRTELTTLCETLAKLQQHVGVEAPQPEELEKVSEALGVLLPSASSISPQPSSSQACPLPTNTQNGIQDKQKPEDLSPEVKDDTPPQLSSVVLRAGSDELVEVSEDEFQSVSALIRGRAKLTEVNQVYGTLWSHFKEQRDKEPLTTQDMHKMGLRVTGQTGEAKLKVLRALKLLTISNKGHVMLV